MKVEKYKLTDVSYYPHVLNEKPELKIYILKIFHLQGEENVSPRLNPSTEDLPPHDKRNDLFLRPPSFMS